MATCWGKSGAKIAEGHLEDLGVTQQSMEYHWKIFKKRIDTDGIAFSKIILATVQMIHVK